MSRDETVADWGTNHLDARIAGVKVEAIAEQIFKWLCKLACYLNDGFSVANLALL